MLLLLGDEPGIDTDETRGRGRSKSNGNGADNDSDCSAPAAAGERRRRLCCLVDGKCLSEAANCLRDDIETDYQATEPSEWEKRANLMD